MRDITNNDESIYTLDNLHEKGKEYYPKNSVYYSSNDRNFNEKQKKELDYIKKMIEMKDPYFLRLLKQYEKEIIEYQEKSAQKSHNSFHEVGNNNKKSDQMDKERDKRIQLREQERLRRLAGDKESVYTSGVKTGEKHNSGKYDMGNSNKKDCSYENGDLFSKMGTHYNVNEKEKKRKYKQELDQLMEIKKLAVEGGIPPKRNDDIRQQGLKENNLYHNKEDQFHQLPYKRGNPKRGQTGDESVINEVELVNRHENWKAQQQEQKDLGLRNEKNLKENRGQKQDKKSEEMFYLFKAQDEENERLRKKKLEKQRYAEELRKQIKEKEEQKIKEKQKKKEMEAQEREMLKRELEQNNNRKSNPSSVNKDQASLRSSDVTITSLDSRKDSGVELYCRKGSSDNKLSPKCDPVVQNNFPNNESYNDTNNKNLQGDPVIQRKQGFDQMGQYYPIPIGIDQNMLEYERVWIETLTLQQKLLYEQYKNMVKDMVLENVQTVKEMELLQPPLLNPYFEKGTNPLQECSPFAVKGHQKCRSDTQGNNFRSGIKSLQSSLFSSQRPLDNEAEKSLSNREKIDQYSISLDQLNFPETEQLPCTQSKIEISVQEFEQSYIKDLELFKQLYTQSPHLGSYGEILDSHQYDKDVPLSHDKRNLISNLIKINKESPHMQISPRSQNSSKILNWDSKDSPCRDLNIITENTAEFSALKPVDVDKFFNKEAKEASELKKVDMNIEKSKHQGSANKRFLIESPLIQNRKENHLIRENDDGSEMSEEEEGAIPVGIVENELEIKLDEAEQSRALILAEEDDDDDDEEEEYDTADIREFIEMHDKIIQDIQINTNSKRNTRNRYGDMPLVIDEDKQEEEVYQDSYDKESFRKSKSPKRYEKQLNEIHHRITRNYEIGGQDKINRREKVTKEEQNNNWEEMTFKPLMMVNKETEQKSWNDKIESLSKSSTKPFDVNIRKEASRKYNEGGNLEGTLD